MINYKLNLPHHVLVGISLFFLSPLVFSAGKLQNMNIIQRENLF